jgi:hypothetical protein
MTIDDHQYWVENAGTGKNLYIHRVREFFALQEILLRVVPITPACRHS